MHASEARYLEKFHALAFLELKLVCPLMKRQGVMIWRSHEGLRLKVVIPIGESPNDSKKLFVISGLVKLGATQLLAKVS